MFFIINEALSVKFRGYQEKFFVELPQLEIFYKEN